MGYTLPVGLGKAPPTFDFIRPVADQWGAGNPPELKFIFTPNDVTFGAAAVSVAINALVYDTHLGSEHRVEQVMEYSPIAAGGMIIGTPVLPVTYGTALGGGSPPGGSPTPFALTLGDDWDGTYEVRTAGETLIPGLFGGPSTSGPVSVYGVGTLRRKTPLVNGTPVAIMFGEKFVPKPPADPYYVYFYVWWFGVGSREAWDWPRSLEAVEFAGKKMPPPFDKLSGVFQVDRRDDSQGIPRYRIPAGYAGVDAFSRDGKVVRQAVVTQPVVRAQSRVPPPLFKTGPLGP